MALKKRNGDPLSSSPSIVLEETGVPRLVRLVIFVLTLVVMAFIGWASETRLDEVAHAYGEITPRGHAKRVEAESGGRVVELLVKNGQRVEEGQPLLVLDRFQARSKVRQLKDRRAALRAKRARLAALVEGGQPDYASLDGQHQELVAEQNSILEQQRRALEVRLDIIRNQINQYEAELKELRGLEKTVQQNYDLVRDEYESYKSLLEQGIVGKSEFANVKRLFLQAQQDLIQIPTKRVQLLEKLTELKNRVQVVRSETLEGWMNELSGVNQNLMELGQNLARLEQDLSRQRLRAPASGLVHALAVNSPGEVVEEGETVLRIVPEQRNLLAETRISPRDVGHITTGQAVKVKVSTFDYARFGTVPGTVESISPSSLTDPEGNVYFQVDVLLERDHVGENPEDNRLQPGMSVQADIVTGDKTLMEYLLKPIYTSARGAFNER